MHIRISEPIAAAILLVGIAVLNAVNGVGGLRNEAPVQREFAAAGAVGRLLLERCQENVAMIHDVYWAAACMTNPGDDSPECTLPSERARALNMARAAAESRCNMEAMAQ